MLTHNDEPPPAPVADRLVDHHSGDVIVLVVGAIRTRLPRRAVGSALARRPAGRRALLPGPRR